MSSDEQTVVSEADPKSKTQGEAGSDAQDDNLENLLNEYTEANQETGEKKPEGEQQTNDDVVQYVRELREREDKERYQKDMKETIAKIKEGLEVQVSDKIVKGFLHAHAEEDPRLIPAWQNKHKNPETWGKVLKAVQKELAKEYGSVDQEVTDGVDAISSAVRSASKASTKEPQLTEKDLNSMDDHEFNKLKRQILGQG